MVKALVTSPAHGKQYWQMSDWRWSFCKMWLKQFSHYLMPILTKYIKMSKNFLEYFRHTLFISIFKIIAQKTPGRNWSKTLSHIFFCVFEDSRAKTGGFYKQCQHFPGQLTLIFTLLSSMKMDYEECQVKNESNKQSYDLISSRSWYVPGDVTETLQSLNPL